MLKPPTEARAQAHSHAEARTQDNEQARTQAHAAVHADSQAPLSRRAVAVAREAVTRFFSDRCAMLGASIAFYSAFSLAPALLIVLAVIGWIFGQEAAQGQFFGQVKQFLGNDAAAAMQEMVAHAHHSSGSGFAAALSVVLLLIGASATFSSLNTALDVIFAAKSPKGIAGLALLVRARLVSIGLLLGLSFLMVVSLVVDAAIQSVGQSIFGNDTAGALANAGQQLLGLVIMAIGLGALIKWLPDTAVHFRPALIGGAVASVLFTIGRHLFGLYLAHAGTAGVFGAAGSLAVLMMWLYFCAVVFLFGAEVSSALGGRKQPEEDDPNAGKNEPLTATGTRS